MTPSELWREVVGEPWFVATLAGIPCGLFAWWLRGRVDHFRFYRVRRPVKTQDPRRVLKALPTLGPSSQRESKP